MGAIVELSVVVPCHDEEANLRPLIDELRTVLDPLGISYEVIVTDDASTDGSWQVLTELAADDARIRAQRFAANRGESAASWAGIHAARGRIVVTLDADLQNDPREIPTFLRALEQWDCVCGTRVQSRHDGDGIVRIASSRIANWVRNRVTSETITDAGCTYRAFRRECVANVKFFRGMHRFLPTLIKMEGFRVTEIPVVNRPRPSGRSHYGVWGRLRTSSIDLLAVRWMQRRSLRYRIAEVLNVPGSAHREQRITSERGRGSVVGHSDSQGR